MTKFLRLIKYRYREERASFIEVYTSIAGIVFGWLLLINSLFTYISDLQSTLIFHLLQEQFVGLLLIAFFTSRLILWCNNVYKIQRVLTYISFLIWVWLSVVFIIEDNAILSYLFTMVFGIGDLFVHVVLVRKLSKLKRKAQTI